MTGGRASQAHDLFDNASSKLRYEAYSRLQAAAVAFGEVGAPRGPGEPGALLSRVCPAARCRLPACRRPSPLCLPPLPAAPQTLNIPEIVAIGGQSDGKSSLLEAFLGVRARRGPACWGWAGWAARGLPG